MNQQAYTNWCLEQDEHHIAWLTLDCQADKVNTYNEAVLNELSQILDHLDSADYKGLVITARQGKGFAGANLEDAQDLTDPNQAQDYIDFVHQTYQHLASLKLTKVMMINGFCLGGGFEMALACDYRVALDERSTKIGLPEVKLGLIPGWQGSVRLSRLIGPVKALSLMLAGRVLDPKQAKKMGMIDAAVPQRHLQTAAINYVLHRPTKQSPAWTSHLVNLNFIRPFIANKMRRNLANNHVYKHHYPAPYHLISNWQQHGVGQAAFKGEAKRVAQLLTQKPTKNLMHVFFLQQRLKQLTHNKDFQAQHVHIIGAGTMGADIAAWCAFSGMTVTLQDQDLEKMAQAVKKAHGLFTKKLKRSHEIQQALDRLVPDAKGLGCSKADVIIEAIFEDLSAKQSLFQSIEKQAKPEAILATNTSSIPLTNINEAMQQPHRLVGIHFFNPVAKMQLVEVVEDDKSDEAIVDHAIQFVKALNRLPLPVKSQPGFLVNRILMPYLLEACYLYQENLPLPAIDQAAINFGMPMGPIELADKVGLDVCLSVAEHVADYYDYEVPHILKEKVDAGHLGVKTAKGFYNYNKAGKPVQSASHYSQDTDISPIEIQNRLTYRYINEAMACWREGIVADSDLLDAGMVFGTGFAPFRGGPLNFAKQMGIDTVLSRLEQLSEYYGSRFEPDPGWGEWRSEDDVGAHSEAAVEEANQEDSLS